VRNEALWNPVLRLFLGSDFSAVLAALSVGAVRNFWSVPPRDLSDGETKIARLGAENLLHENILPGSEFNYAFFVR